MTKYNIDQELETIAKIKMPDNPALLPLMNRIIGFSKCCSDDIVIVTRHKTPGYDGAILDTLVMEPVHHKGELPCINLALAVSLMARDRGLRMPDAELLVYPVTDRRMTTDSMKKYVDTPVFDAKLSKMMWDAYLGHRQPERIEYASPLEAASFAQFPPTYIEVAQFDALHDEGVLLYQKLREQGISAELHEVNGACHGFETATKSNLLKTCIEGRINWLRSARNLE